jgi:hypothetical protein
MNYSQPASTCTATRDALRVLVRMSPKCLFPPRKPTPLPEASILPCHELCNRKLP